MLSDQRRGEIAYSILMHQLRKEGICPQNLKRDLGNMATATGIPLAELQCFMKIAFEDIFDEVFRETFSSKGGAEKG